MQNNQSGHLAEFMALCYLRLKGYKFVARNLQNGHGTGAGEIDLIVKKQQTLVFVEVKKRRDIATAAHSILPKQQARIRRSAESFLAHHSEYGEFDIRFDAVLVEFPFKLKHITNAF